MLKRIAGLMLAVLFFLVSSRAWADAIVITGGSYVPTSGGTFTLIGERFSLTAADDFPSVPCDSCPPNTPLFFSTNLNEAPFSTGAPGTFDNVFYPATYLNGNLMFTAPTLNTSLLAPSNLTLTFPFTLTGDIVGFSSITDEHAYFNNGNTSGAFVDAPVVGSGTGTARFTLAPTSPGSQPVFQDQSLIYQFGPQTPSPTPEPASLLLLGTGIAGIFGRRAWNKSHR